SLLFWFTTGLKEKARQPGGPLSNAVGWAVASASRAFSATADPSGPGRGPRLRRQRLAQPRCRGAFRGTYSFCFASARSFLSPVWFRTHFPTTSPPPRNLFNIAHSGKI